MKNSRLTQLSITLTGTVLFWGATATTTKAASLVYVSSSTGEVGTINEFTGTFKQVASSPAFTDIALSNQSKLYGITSSQLFNVNLTTGTSSLIGNLGTFLNGLGFGTNNLLYGTGGSGFYQVNALTGVSQLISTVSGFSSSGDIVYDPTNNKFFASSIGDSLWSIDPNTGSANKIGNINFANVYGLFFESGDLYGFTGNGQQIAINQQNGAGTFYQQLNGVPGNIWGSASLPSGASISSPVDSENTPPPPESVPEPITILSTLFGVMGFYWLRKRSPDQQSSR